MSRLIDADKLKAHYAWWGDGNGTELSKANKEVFDTIVDLQPTADVAEIRKDGEWEMFDLISSAYYGKGMYFKQDNGTVYSRYSCKYMSVDEAIREFISLIDGTEEDDE